MKIAVCGHDWITSCTFLIWLLISTIRLGMLEGGHGCCPPPPPTHTSKMFADFKSHMTLPLGTSYIVFLNTGSPIPALVPLLQLLSQQQCHSPICGRGGTWHTKLSMLVKGKSYLNLCSSLSSEKQNQRQYQDKWIKFQGERPPLSMKKLSHSRRQ
jgi:hypothetical protein